MKPLWVWAACAAALVACAGDDTGPEATDAGPTTRDVGTSDVASDSRGETLVDVSLDGSAEADAIIDNPGIDPLIGSAQRASAAAQSAYCGCCLFEFADDVDLCQENALGGGFDSSECRVDVLLRLGDQAEGFLRCTVDALNAVRSSTAECSQSDCVALQQQWERARVACESSHTTTARSLEACD